VKEGEGGLAVGDLFDGFEVIGFGMLLCFSLVNFEECRFFAKFCSRGGFYKAIKRFLQLINSLISFPNFLH
jgi:hypothetical protein